MRRQWGSGCLVGSRYKYVWRFHRGRTCPRGTASATKYRRGGKSWACISVSQKPLRGVQHVEYPSTNISPTLPSFPPPKPYLVFRDTLCSCEANGRRPVYEEKDRGTTTRHIRTIDPACTPSHEWPAVQTHSSSHIPYITLEGVLSFSPYCSPQPLLDRDSLLSSLLL